MIGIKAFVFNPLMENTYVVYDESKECVIVDPGCYHSSEKDELSNFIRQQDLRPVKLLNTHCHIDHVLGNYYCKSKYKISLYAHPKEEQVLRAVKAYAPSWGFNGYEEAEIDHFLDEQSNVDFGNSSLRILSVPGHSPGHIAFYAEKEKKLIGGDVLFHESIGRTDLPGGNYQTLISSIRNQLFVLDDEVVVYPGHGSTTTIGHEKRYNPFCGEKASVR